MDGSAGSATAIAAGSSHSCAIQAGTGAVVCWGTNHYGQATPPPSVNGTAGAAIAIATGANHTLAIRALTQCDDNLDNDGDGHVDRDDPGCPYPQATLENPACDDAHNDGDGHIDADDPGCVAPFVPIEDPPCDDGIDNDGDGQTDAADPGCPCWEQAPCGLGVELAAAIPLLAWLRRSRERARWRPREDSNPPTNGLGIAPDPE